MVHKEPQELRAQGEHKVHLDLKVQLEPARKARLELEHKVQPEHRALLAPKAFKGFLGDKELQELKAQSELKAFKEFLERKALKVF